MATPLDKLIRDKDGKVVIWQSPNLALWIWIVATLLGIVTHGMIHDQISLVGSAGILIWASIEIWWGDSLIRRVAGGVVFAVVAISFIHNH